MFIGLKSFVHPLEVYLCQMYWSQKFLVSLQAFTTSDVTPQQSNFAGWWSTGWKKMNNAFFENQFCFLFVYVLNSFSIVLTELVNCRSGTTCWLNALDIDRKLIFSCFHFFSFSNILQILIQIGRQIESEWTRSPLHA